MPFQKQVCFKLTVLSVFLIFNFYPIKKGFSENPIVKDSIVKMHGYIYDILSENLDTVSVHAKIIFQSLPYGSEIGIISSCDTSGYYEYHINLAHNYSVEIKSDNHQEFLGSIDSNQLMSDGEIMKNFYLVPHFKENQVIRLNKLIFEQGESSITSESFGELNTLAKLLNENKSIQIQLEGHTDYRGDKKLNTELSQNRVKAVKEYLMAKGLTKRRIKTKSFGGKKPLVKEISIESSKINRRVEVRILKLN
jgi:OOP family OmpA-OmpF porin